MQASTEDHHNHINGMTTSSKPSPLITSTKGGMKTEALSSSSTGNHSSISNNITTSQTFITRHCSSLIRTNSSRLIDTQTRLEHRVKTSLRNLHRKQLYLSHTHSKSQVDAYKLTNGGPPQPYPPSSEPSSTNTSLNLSACTNEDSLLSDSPSHSMTPNKRKRIEGYKEVSTSLRHHLKFLESFVDDEATCSSSDEEEEEERGGKRRRDTAGGTKSKNDMRRNAIKQRWERDRAKLGSQWAWLCHQITTLNQKLYQIDHLIQSSDPKETVQLTPPTPCTTTVPCVCGNVQNGHTDQKRNNNALGNKSNSSKFVNGIQCTCQVRQMLLSNPSLVSHSTAVQVSDLMNYSFPLVLMDETSQVCARTKGVVCAPRRKLVRMKKKRRRKEEGREEKESLSKTERKKGREEMIMKDTYHSHLSQPKDIPSSVWLDSALHRILQEHSYASLPLTKRKKGGASSSLSSLSHNVIATGTTISNDNSNDSSFGNFHVGDNHATDHHMNHSLLRLERSKSFSPSPLDTSNDKYGKVIPRKRLSANSASFSEDFSQPATPTALAKKKKGVTTPQYDINNIVIPYSILSSTARLEKLEYKEIITPKWRCVQPSKYSTPLTNGNGHHSPSLTHPLSSHPLSFHPLSSHPHSSHPHSSSHNTPVYENGLQNHNGKDKEEEEEEKEKEEEKKIVNDNNKKGMNGDGGLSIQESDEEDDSNMTFMIRHDRCEAKEKNRYLNFVTGSRKRPRLSHLSSTPDSGTISPSLPATPPLMDVEVVPQIPPWQQRHFPLIGKDLENLKNIEPPPKKIIQYVPILEYSRLSSSPSPLPSHVPSTPPPNSGDSTTPTTNEECPLTTDPHHWTVNTTHIKTFQAQQPAIVLKLSKQTLA